MSIDDDRKMMRRFIEEVYQNGNFGLVEEMVADDIEEHEEMGGGTSVGREGIIKSISDFRKAFPDLSVTIEDEFAEGDRIFMRSTWHGTHQGEFMGIDPTGKQVSFESMDEIRMDHGKLKEHWGITDTLSLLVQLGALSLPGPPG